MRNDLEPAYACPPDRCSGRTPIPANYARTLASFKNHITAIARTGCFSQYGAQMLESDVDAMLLSLRKSKISLRTETEEKKLVLSAAVFALREPNKVVATIKLATE